MNLKHFHIYFLLSVLVAAPLAQGQITISEFLASNSNSIADEDGDN